MMMYAGDEDYGDEITSPLYRPTFQKSERSPRRYQVKKVKRAIYKARPSVYEEFADLYDEPSRPLPMNGTDYHVFGEV